MNLIITTPPTAEPISLTQAKLQCHIDGTEYDTYLPAAIKAARMYCEKFLRGPIIGTEFELAYDDFPCWFELHGQAKSVSNIKYYDTALALQTLSTTYYNVDTRSTPARVIQAYGYTWPTVAYQYPNAVILKYWSGYSLPFTAATATGILTLTGRNFTDGEVVRLWSTGTLPASLSTETNYYVRDASTNTCKLSLTSGGTALTLSDTGTGTHFVGEIPANILQAMLILIAHYCETREPDKTAENIKLSVESLLWLDRDLRF
jgi:hypothetical protein